MLRQIAFTLACLAFPVLWGVAVNWAFRQYRSRRLSRSGEDSQFPDFQI